MLLELVVENYAVVERLRVHFHAGLNLLTGETGSGKSIVVDALGLLLGGAGIGRHDPHRRVARPGGRHLRRPRPRGRAPAAGAGGNRSRRRRAAHRARDSGGRQVARVCGQPSGGGVAAEGPGAAPGGYPRTARPAAALFGGCAARHAGRVRGQSRAAGLGRRGFTSNGAAAAAELEELERTEQEKLRLLDLWCFQRKEIESAALEAGRRRGARKRAAGAAERAAASGERRDGLRRGVRRPRIGAFADAHGGQASGGTVPHRCHARRTARASRSRRT